jgi:hypothetical protein
MPKHGDRALLICQGQVMDWQAHVIARAPHSTAFGLLDGAVLQLRGTLKEPPRGIAREFDLTVRRGTADVRTQEDWQVGVLISTRRGVKGYLTLTAGQYQTLLTLTTSGHLCTCAFEFQSPRQGRGLISAVAFSSGDLPASGAPTAAAMGGTRQREPRFLSPGPADDPPE